LELAPNLRHELISNVGDITRWNEPGSVFKRVGTDHIKGFFFDELRLEEGAGRFVGGFIFADEVALLDDFVKKLDAFIYDPAPSVTAVALHKRHIPAAVLEAAHRLKSKLEEKGIPVPIGESGS
jgi:hypothetical protein